MYMYITAQLQAWQINRKVLRKATQHNTAQKTDKATQQHNYDEVVKVLAALGGIQTCILHNTLGNWGSSAIGMESG